MAIKADYLHTPVEHIDITTFDPVPLVEAMGKTAFTARDLARAADITHRMVKDQDCGVILCLAGSLVSAGLKKVFVDAIRCNMVDAIVSTGANIVDQDFFEALGFRHWVGEEKLRSGMFDAELRDLHIDRIYDTLINEDELRICDDTTRAIADELDPRPHSSREYIRAMGAYLEEHGCKTPTASCTRRSRPTCRSSARRSRTARPGSGWSRTSTCGGTGRSCRWTAPRTSTN